MADVANEVFFTFISLLILFALNTFLFRFNRPAGTYHVGKDGAVFRPDLVDEHLLGKFSSSFTIISTFRRLMRWCTITCIRCAILSLPVS